MAETQVKDQEDAGLIRAWHEAEEAKVPAGVMAQKEVKVDGMPDGLGMRYHSLEEAGWVVVYHQETGDRSVVNKNMLGVQLSKKLPNGKKAFDIYPPKDKNGDIITPVRGTYKCMLHSEEPNRDEYTRMGLPVCNKSNIPSPQALIWHMAAKHKREWKSIKEDQERVEKDEDRKFQRALYERLVNSEVSNPEYVCSICGKECKNKLGYTSHMKSHEK